MSLENGGSKSAPTVTRSWPRWDLNPHLTLRQGRILSELDYGADLPPPRFWVEVVYKEKILSYWWHVALKIVEEIFREQPLKARIIWELP